VLDLQVIVNVRIQNDKAISAVANQLACVNARTVGQEDAGHVDEAGQGCSQLAWPSRRDL
jgi:hypothetical protein